MEDVHPYPLNMAKIRKNYSFFSLYLTFVGYSDVVSVKHEECVP